MHTMFQIISEQFSNYKIIRRMAKFDDKATYQSHYLGLAWEFLNPLIQIGIYYLIYDNIPVAYFSIPNTLFISYKPIKETIPTVTSKISFPKIMVISAIITKIIPLKSLS